MKKNYLLLITAVALTAIGCQPPTVDTNANVNTVINENMNSNMMNSNSNMMNSNVDESASIIESKEPEKYQAKVTMSFEAVGESKGAKLPAITATVARDGDNRKIEFNAPNNQNFAYIDTTDKNILVMPSRKQYANINRDSVGLDPRRFMTPENMVKNVKQLKGVTKVGEEKVNGRDAVKYKYESLTDTKTKAGEVETESYVLVDKETGLPLRTETVLESKNKQVQGFSGMRLVTEMSDIKTDVSEDMFAVPADFKEVEEAQIRGQVNLVFNAAMMVIQQLMQSAQSTTAQPQSNSNNTF
jgi:hypothetical protein